MKSPLTQLAEMLPLTMRASNADEIMESAASLIQDQDSVARKIGDLRVRIERLEQIVHGMPRPRAEKSQLEQVIELLNQHPGEWITASDIALKTGMSGGAVRMILCTNKDTFEKFNISAKRVKFRLRARVAVDQRGAMKA